MLGYIEKINILPEVDLRSIQEYRRIIGNELRDKDSKEGLYTDFEGYVLSDKIESTSKDRSRVLKVFKKFDTDEQYYKFGTVFKRLSIFDYQHVIILAYWYTYFLYKEGRATDKDMLVGYQCVVDFIIKDKDTNKIYSIKDISALLEIERQGNLKFEKVGVTFTPHEEDSNLSRVNIDIIEDNRYDLTFGGMEEYYIEAENRHEYISYEAKYTQDFLNVIDVISKDNREILIVLIYGLKVLKKSIIRGYSFDKFETARKITRSIEEIRENLLGGNSDWVDTLMTKNELFGWWD